jgi:hypothetical protein
MEDRDIVDYIKHVFSNKPEWQQEVFIDNNDEGYEKAKRLKHEFELLGWKCKYKGRSASLLVNNKWSFNGLDTEEYELG